MPPGLLEVRTAQLHPCGLELTWLVAGRRRTSRKCSPGCCSTSPDNRCSRESRLARFVASPRCCASLTFSAQCSCIRSSSAVVHLRIKAVNPFIADIYDRNLVTDLCACASSFSPGVARSRACSQRWSVPLSAHLMMQTDWVLLQDLHRHIQGDRDDKRGSLFFLRSHQDEADPRPSETPLMERAGHVEQAYRQSG